MLIGSGLGGTTTLIDQISTWRVRGPDRVSPFFIPMAIGNMPSGQAAISFGALGPNFSTTSACASSGHSIGESYEMIKRGDAEVMISGGCEAPVLEATVAGFSAMRALSTRNDDPAGASRPFDSGRDGFVVAEGAAMLVLEELEHAEARGARIQVEVLGYAATADAHHITSPSPGGTGAVRAARRALEKADLGADAIDMVSAHATSTPGGDPTELEAINTIVGDRAGEVSVTAIKSAIGHTLGAAGAVAAVATIKALQNGIVPPTLNLDHPDPAAGDLDLTPGKARRRDLDVALVNAFGFGGQNAAVLLRRWPT
jgi:3-oxoacyl-[acyl-carrier-protein] synthase II